MGPSIVPMSIFGMPIMGPANMSSIMDKCSGYASRVIAFFTFTLSIIASYLSRNYRKVWSNLQ
ncbi:MAG: hypothetical protein V3U16_03265 [Candidatus Neomarinimicrobiota bacterium]